MTAVSPSTGLRSCSGIDGGGVTAGHGPIAVNSEISCPRLAWWQEECAYFYLQAPSFGNVLEDRVIVTTELSRHVQFSLNLLHRDTK